MSTRDAALRTEALEQLLTERGLIDDERYQAEWVPEFSRRARGFAVYAALRELGRSGVAALVERCCRCARLMAEELEGDPRATVLNDVVLNQVLVRVACDGANVTDKVIDALQREGTCWMSGTEWEGEHAMRISVCNWRTTEDDIRRHCEANLTGYKRPKYIEFRTELPKTNVGKILRRALRDEALAGEKKAA